MQMPVLDGFQTMKIIRENPKFKCLPILALTANAIHEEYEKCMKAGASEYLSKPFLPDDLFSKIVKLLHSKPDKLENTTLNLSHLNLYTNGKKPLIRATLKELASVLNNEIFILEKQLEESDVKGIRARMHKLKPNFRMIGFEELAKIADQIEKETSIQLTLKLTTAIHAALPELRESILMTILELSERETNIIN
jgi:two-component system sensor histidine kinase/response regulator